jgi:tRNA dimethylallyltransferase
LKLVLSMPRDVLRERIAERTRELFAAGWVQEVERLLKAGTSDKAPAMLSIGYADIAAAIVNREDPEDALSRVIVITRQYAKRQETFFRSEKDAVWIDMSHTGATEQARGLVNDFLRPAPPH